MTQAKATKTPETRIGQVSNVYRIGRQLRTKTFKGVTEETNNPTILIGVELLDQEDFEGSNQQFVTLEMLDSVSDQSNLTKTLTSLGLDKLNVFGLIGKKVNIQGTTYSYDDPERKDKFFGKKLLPLSTRDAKAFADKEGELTATAFSYKRPTAGTSILELAPWIVNQILNGADGEAVRAALEEAGTDMEALDKIAQEGAPKGSKQAEIKRDATEGDSLGAFANAKVDRKPSAKKKQAESDDDDFPF